MKLATFDGGSGNELGVVEEGRIVALNRDTSQLPTDMIELIAQWSEIGPEVRRIAREAKQSVDLAQVRLRAPIVRPRKIMAIGLNYADHVKETGRELPKDQVWFCKQPTAINGPFDPIQIPKVSSMVDWEAEMVAVIGKRGRHISKATAPAHVFGYCCGNDVSVRDWQNRTPQWVIGKSFDTHAPIGPWITTADEAGDPHSHNIRCIVNGITRQESNTSHLIFNVWNQIALLSQAMTLEPGDLIFTGTPGGVGMAMNPPIFLTSGDSVRVEIEDLGAIEGRCVDEDAV